MRRSWLVLQVVCWPITAGCAKTCDRPAGAQGDPQVAARSTDGSASGPAARDGGKCGALSYGLHQRAGDTIADIQVRHAGKVPCATRCDPQPPFATSTIRRVNEGGMGAIDLDPRSCQFEGMTLPIAKCWAICEHRDLLGEVFVELEPKDAAARGTLCRAFEARRGPPDVGSCDCLADDIVWKPNDVAPAVVLHFYGTYVLDCGFPDASYWPVRTKQPAGP